jgi:hypothetical protein
MSLSVDADAQRHAWAAAPGLQDYHPGQAYPQNQKAAIQQAAKALSAPAGAGGGHAPQHPLLFDRSLGEPPRPAREDEAGRPCFRLIKNG